MFLSREEEIASKLAENLLGKYGSKALRTSFGELNSTGRVSRILRESTALRRFAKWVHSSPFIDRVTSIFRETNSSITLNKSSIGIFRKFLVHKSNNFVEMAAEPIPEGLTLEFPGGTLKLIERTREGYLARAYPKSRINGTLLQAHILSRMLKGLYPNSYSDQGDLLWKSVLMRVDRALELLKEFEINEGIKKELALESALRSTKLWPILAMLMLEDCTEAYAQLGGNLIIEHVLYGRIRVENYVFDEDDLKKFMTFIEADPNSGFEFRRSLAEVDLVFVDHKFRIALDVPPSSRGSLDLRNLSAMSKLSLPRLISLGVLSEEEASLMLAGIEEGRPMIIFGRTGVGKTTLANAILAALPRDLRLISVEEVREIEDLSIYGMHHSPYEVPRGKLDFIRFLLHRNPDLVFLGEILTKEQAEAFSLAHVSGLGVIATSHARGYEGLVRKWEGWGLEIPEGTLAVLMERRKVAHMMEWNGAWIPTQGSSPKWLSILEYLRGAHTNEEVGERICELEGLRKLERSVC